MWTLSAFADEISPEPDLQIKALQDKGIHHLELRGAWGKNVLALGDSEVEQLKSLFDWHGVRVSSIGSPIGKIGIDDPFEPHLAACRRGLELARTFDAPFMRIFSFFMPPGADPASYREQVLDRMGRIVRAAEGSGVTLLHENEKEIYGDIPERCLDILREIDSPTLRAAWDPANFVQCGVRPFTDGFDMLRPYIAYVHVKDALLASGEVVPAGKGDGEWPATITALQDSGFDGFFSLEPHLQEAGTYAGFSGPALFGVAADALIDLLRAQNIDWN